MDLRPLALPHVDFGVVEAESLDFDDDVAREWFWDGQVFEGVSGGEPRVGEDNGLHFCVWLLDIGEGVFLVILEF